MPERSNGRKMFIESADGQRLGPSLRSRNISLLGKTVESNPRPMGVVDHCGLPWQDCWKYPGCHGRIPLISGCSPWINQKCRHIGTGSVIPHFSGQLPMAGQYPAECATGAARWSSEWLRCGGWTHRFRAQWSSVSRSSWREAPFSSRTSAMTYHHLLLAQILRPQDL